MGADCTYTRMAPTTATVQMDNKGRITIPKAVRKKLGIDDLDQGEKKVVHISVST